MKKLILISLLSLVALGSFSVVNADDCTYDTGLDAYNCNAAESCSQSNCLCDGGVIHSGDVCGGICVYDTGLDAYDCNIGDLCENSNCLCDGGVVHSGDVCQHTVVSCTHAGEVFYEGESRQRFLSGPILPYGGSCQAGTVTCTATGIVGDTGFLYTGCIVDPTPPVVTGSCNLPGYGIMLSGEVLTGFSQSSVCSPSVCPVLNVIVCLDGVLSGGTSYSEIEYSSCSVSSCGGGGSGGGGGGGGGGGSSTPICDLEDLVCVDGTYEKIDGVYCVGGGLGNSCNLSTGDNGGSSTTSDIFNFTRIGDISGSPYSAELNLAYLYAYNMGITTRDNIFAAKLEDNLIRSHMAKMLVQWAVAVRGIDADTGLNCDFDDIDSLQGQDLYQFIILACQMGLMGLDNDGNPATSFHPNNLVTRAQFGTVLSRAIWGNYYNGGSPYYVSHLSILNTLGIMNNISNPAMHELRGYVMLMLLRANQVLE